MRPGLERLRDLAAEGQIEVVLVHAPDRLGRKYTYQALLIEELARHGVETIFMTAPQAVTAEDQLFVQFQGMIAEYERAQIPRVGPQARPWACLERSRRGKRHPAPAKARSTSSAARRRAIVMLARPATRQPDTRSSTPEPMSSGWSTKAISELAGASARSPAGSTSSVFRRGVQADTFSGLRSRRHNRYPMIPWISSAVLPLLHRIDPETVHNLALWSLRTGLLGRPSPPEDPMLATYALGLDFTNPIGLAAGFDKNAVAIAPLMRLGFGFIEVGTVTLRPQGGNPRPRLFRLTPDRAAVNRLGFNNQGLPAYLARIAARPRTAVVLGCNIGINKDGADPERDYPALVEAVAPYADYVVINVSSPNTPGLRDLQNESRLQTILLAVKERVARSPPILVKISPDLSIEGLAGVVEICVGSGVQGLIVSNTTVSRPPGLRSPEAQETGGLSGAPLFPLSTAMLARTFLLARGRLTLIGVGGVFSGVDALTKIRAGASLVQLYTGFAFSGPALIPRIKAELARALRGAGFANVQQAIGTDAERLARSP